MDFHAFIPSLDHATVAFFSWLSTIAAHADLRRAWLDRIRRLERRVFGRAVDDVPAAPSPTK